MDITICDDGFVAEVKDDSDFNALMTMMFGEPEEAEEGGSKTMWNYLFEITSEWSENCGEQFFVQCNTREEADEVLSNYFWGDKVEYRGKYTDEEAEMMGLDTY